MKVTDLSITTHAVEAMIDRAPKLPPKHGSLMQSLATLMRSAQIFKLPEGGQITGVTRSSEKDICDQFLEWGARLPYPSIVIEYENVITGDDSGKNDDRLLWPDMEKVNNAPPALVRKTVVFASQAEESDLVRIAVAWELISDNRKMWSLPLAIFLVEPKEGIRIAPVAALTQSQQKFYLNDCSMEIASVIELIAALSCCNVHTSDIPAPSRMNKKREAKNKTPFFTYKVLEITTSDKSAAKTNSGGTHASPRIHLRRGHIRRLPSGNIWVNAHVVGDKSKGMVVKDYRLIAG